LFLRIAANLGGEAADWGELTMSNANAGFTWDTLLRKKIEKLRRKEKDVRVHSASPPCCGWAKGAYRKRSRNSSGSVRAPFATGWNFTNAADWRPFVLWSIKATQAD
jgi:hypothetical protein